MKSSYFTATRNASDWEVSKKEPALFIRYLSKEGYALFERTNIQLAHSREPNVWSNAAIKKNHQELISKKGVIFQQENSKMHISFGEQKQNHSNIVAKFVSFFFFFFMYSPETALTVCHFKRILLTKNNYILRTAKTILKTVLGWQW